jgi:hypothetical protein
VRLGVLRGDLKADPSTETTFRPFDRAVGGARMKATLDQIDNISFPTHGNYSRLDMFFSREGLGADDEYDKAEFRTVQAWTAWRGTKDRRPRRFRAALHRGQRRGGQHLDDLSQASWGDLYYGGSLFFGLDLSSSASGWR